MPARRTLNLLLLIAVVSSAGIGRVWADDTGSSSTSSATIFNIASTQKDAMTNASIFSFDYGAPTSPALKLVSASPDKFTTSNPLKPYVISLPAYAGGASGADAYAADVSPLWLFDLISGHLNSYDNYEKDAQDGLAPLMRLRFGAALNQGTNAGGNASKQVASKFGFGFSTSLLDDNDPALTPDPTSSDSSRTYWDSCTDQIWDKGDATTGKPDGVGQIYLRQFNNTIGNKANDVLGKISEDLTVDASQTKAGASVDAPNTQNTYLHLNDCFKAPTCEAFDPDPYGANGLKALVAGPAPLNYSSQQVKTIQAVFTKMVAKGRAANTAILGDVTTAMTECVSDVNLLAAHAPAWDFGFGTDWQGVPGKLKDFSVPAEVVWSGFRLPLWPAFTAGNPFASGDAKKTIFTYLMIGGSVRAGWDELVATADKTTPQIRANTIDSWLGLSYVGTGFQLSGQAGYLQIDARSSAQSSFSDSGIRWLASGSLRLGDSLSGIVTTVLTDFNQASVPKDGIWLNVSYGSVNGTSTTLKDKTFLVSLNYSQPSSSTFGSN